MDGQLATELPICDLAHASGLVATHSCRGTQLNNRACSARFLVPLQRREEASWWCAEDRCDLSRSVSAFTTRDASSVLPASLSGTTTMSNAMPNPRGPSAIIENNERLLRQRLKQLSSCDEQKYTRASDSLAQFLVSKPLLIAIRAQQGVPVPQGSIL